MNIWNSFHEWLENYRYLTWEEFYNFYVSCKWNRANKLRNYKRNKDIIYNNTSTKRNSTDVETEIIPVEQGDFFFENGNLYLTYKDKGFNTSSSFSQNPVIAMVNDEMNLLIKIHDKVEETNFIIDADSCLYNTGIDKYELKGQDLYSSDELLLRLIPVQKERIRPFNYITMELDEEYNLYANIPTIILDSKFEINNNNGELWLIY